MVRLIMYVEWYIVGDAVKPRKDRFRILPLIHAGRPDNFRVDSAYFTDFRLARVDKTAGRGILEIRFVIF